MKGTGKSQLPALPSNKQPLIQERQYISHRESRLNMSPNFMHGLAVECSQQMKLVS